MLENAQGYYMAGASERGKDVEFFTLLISPSYHIAYLCVKTKFSPSCHIRPKGTVNTPFFNKKRMVKGYQIVDVTYYV